MYLPEIIINAISTFLENIATSLGRIRVWLGKELGEARLWFATKQPWVPIAIGLYTIIGLALFVSLYAMLLTAVIVLIVLGAIVTIGISIFHTARNIHPAQRATSAWEELNPTERVRSARDRVGFTWQQLHPGQRLAASTQAIQPGRRFRAVTSGIVPVIAHFPWRRSVGVAVVLGSVFIGVQFMQLPANLVQATQNQSVQVIDRNGIVLYESAGLDGGIRQQIPLEKISPYVIAATVATEDGSFWTNPGINPTGLARAAYENIAFWQYKGVMNGSGGSSITQQLVRNLFYEAPYERSLTRKASELLQSVALTTRYSKEQILESYLNEIFYGNNAYGIEAAAHQYFGKNAAELTLSESALMAGLPNAPATANPLSTPTEQSLWPVDTLEGFSNNHLIEIGLASTEGLGGLLATLPDDRLKEFPPNVLSQVPEEHRNSLPDALRATIPAEPQTVEPPAPSGVPNRSAKERQEKVLDLMVAHGDITREMADTAKAEQIRFTPTDYSIRAPHFVMYVLDELRSRYPNQMKKGGLRIVTSLDIKLQEVGEGVVANQVANTKNTIRGNDASLVAMDPRSGEILAMVGSADYFNQEIDGQVNMVVSPRQPGSSFKPFTYATAFMKGMTPATILQDVPTIFVDTAGKQYKPDNFNKKCMGNIPVRTALSNSVNVTAVRTMAFTGVDPVLDTAHRMGVTTLNDGPYGLALTLGAGEAKLLDMAYAYGVFGTGGKMVGQPATSAQQAAGLRTLDPVAILQIDDYSGRTLYQYRSQERQVLAADIAYLITDILSDNEARKPVFGNGLQLPNGRPAAVKTGTTDDLRDFWTIGFTPTLVTGVWMGNANNLPLAGGTSATTTGPIWEQFMAQALADSPVVPFARPADIIDTTVCRATGLPATSPCGPTYSERFTAAMVANPAAALVQNPNIRTAALPTPTPEAPPEGEAPPTEPAVTSPPPPAPPAAQKPRKKS